MCISERIKEFASNKGLKIAEFERVCGLGNGYVRNIRNSIGRGKLEDILRIFPDLNRVWLLTGEGEMLNHAGVHQSVKGDGNTTVAGNGNNVNITMLESMMTEMTEQRKMFQAQIDRLISIIEQQQLAESKLKNASK